MQIEILRGVDSQDLDKNLQGICEIQAQLRYIESTDLSRGFLVGMNTLESLRGLLSSGARFYLAKKNGELCGYLLSCGTDELEALARNGGRLELAGGIDDWRSASYIYQIAIKPAFLRNHIGQKLMAKMSATETGPKIADVLTYPRVNEASTQFFRKLGFRAVGKLVTKGHYFVNQVESEIFWKDN